MRFTSFLFLSGLFAVGSAHFQLQFPPPRGVFVEDSEPTFCDGYTSAVPNRTVFPLSGGFISINSEHPLWTLGVELSTLANPTSFQNFTLAVPYFQVNGEGAYCFPVDFAAAGIPDVTDGWNVTIQMIFDGGDGHLYQCADLTLSSTATISSSIACTNATGDTVQTIGASAPPVSAAPKPSGSMSMTMSMPAPTGSNGASVNTASVAAGLLALFGATLSLL